MAGIGEFLFLLLFLNTTHHGSNSIHYCEKNHHHHHHHLPTDATRVQKDIGVEETLV
jgi:hypothetical protein